MELVLRHLLTAPPTPRPMDSIDAWWARHLEVTGGHRVPVHRAMLAGFASDRPAYAFASGYQEALRCLLGDLAPEAGATRLALCATEAGGNHPRAIATRLEPGGGGHRLSGHKTYTTLGSHAQSYLVLASVGSDDQGRNRLAAVRIPAGRDGVRVDELAARELSIVPEIPHARLHFDRVRVEPHERLPGDGYERYLKPFRTVEDCHVYAALVAWILQVGRRAGWPERLIEALGCTLVAAAGIATADPSSPATHVALAGLLAQSDALLLDSHDHWDRVDEDTRARWRRDRALLQIAGKARARRREVAWARLRAPGVPG